MSWDSNCGKRKDKNWSLIITTDIGRWAFFGSANWPSCCIFAMDIRLLTSELKNTRESELIKAPIKDWASTHCGTVLSTLQTLTLFPTRRLVKELVREVKASEWQQNLTPGSSVQSLFPCCSHFHIGGISPFQLLTGQELLKINLKLTSMTFKDDYSLDSFPSKMYL